MNEDFVSYEIAKKLKEKGFEWNQITTYNPKTKVRNNHIEPTISQVLKWLRKEKKIFILIDVRKELSWFYEVWGIDISLHPLGCVPYQKSQSYEEAALAGIWYVLDNLI